MCIGDFQWIAVHGTKLGELTMKVTRRTALMAGGAAVGAGLFPRTSPGRVIGANEKVNVAWCGVGGRGPRIIGNFERAGTKSQLRWEIKATQATIIFSSRLGKKQASSKTLRTLMLT